MKPIFQLMLLMCVTLLSACSLGPQTLTLSPQLSFEQLKGVVVPIELVIKDSREDKQVLGYRNAKKEGAIQVNGKLEQVIGETVQQALLAQGIKMQEGAETYTKLQLDINKLHYSTPDESWVNHVDLQTEILLSVSRGGASFKKRFSGNRSQDVATAPSAEFNEKYINGLLSELINKAMNDKEVVEFLK